MEGAGGAGTEEAGEGGREGGRDREREGGVYIIIIHL